MSELFPRGITEIGDRVDNVQIFLIIVMVFWYIACNAVLVYFMFRYKRKGPDDKVSTIKGSHTLEWIWTLIPTVMCAIIFFYGVQVWEEMRTMPDDSESYVVEVTGKKWSWTFRHPDGRIEARDLYVPQGKKVKLKMNSLDVLHSFFIPAFRVKEDVVPSFYTYLWFKADKPGSYRVFCTEYCGDDHSVMMAQVHVLDPETWLRFENNEPLDPNKKILTPLENGEELYVKQGCNSCHTTDGAAAVGPSFAGLFGKEEVILVNGAEKMIEVDDNYLRKSIVNPNSEIVKGYPAGQMPAFEGLLSETDIADLITYIKSLQ